MKNDLFNIQKEIENCALCPRLREHCLQTARTKKREFREETYWGKPVPGFGDPKAKILIVGLAPAAHGANRTGRMFTGDKSGEWLYRALYKYGFASQATSTHRTDGMKLSSVYISAAARCAPPDNKPAHDELLRCFQYLRAEWEVLDEVEMILALGQIAFEAVQKLLAGKLVRPKLKFGHNQLFEIEGTNVLTSYHPSRQNTQTGRLSDAMWMTVFERLRRSFPA